MEEEASHHGGGREEIKEMSQQESPITPDRGMRVSLATLVTVEAGRPQATKSMGFTFYTYLPGRTLHLGLSRKAQEEFLVTVTRVNI